MRQMPAKPGEGEPGREGVAQGEALRDPASDEAGGPPREHPEAGLAKRRRALVRQNLLLA
jgi:hypothetical protein